MNKFDRKYKKIARRISPLDLTSNFSQEDLSWDDFFTDRSSVNSSSLFLGKYSEDGIKFIMERFGLDRQARHLGLRHLAVAVDTRDPYRHRLTIYNGRHRDKDHIVMDFVAKYQHLVPKDIDAENEYSHQLKVLMVEWLLLQNPKADFSHRRRPLPGQRYPGLGLGDQLMALFTLMGRHLQVDGIINVPEYFHTGLIFSKRFVFLSPIVQALVHQVAHDLWKKYRLAVIAWASATDSIINIETGEPQIWEPRRQIIPIQSQLRQYFKSDEYIGIAQRVKDEKVFTLDEEKLREALSKMERPPFQF
ncbi:MAG: hypothetical protein H8E26_12430 [FCB group bacterium]|nr:hypothetical protein [FCB group bacterium]MBL7028034.1 hypothetical protein [Candidatus Neomarinimicrobiota bacterium]MBL7122772.1 hypothetical protein [Candidatus Neomarinimicrobiota bacterium]